MKTKATKTPRVLANVAAKNAIDAQETARLAGQRAINEAIEAQVRTIAGADTARSLAKSDYEKSQMTAAGTLERTMRELSKLADKSKWTLPQIDAGLDYAMKVVYGERNKATTVTKLRSYLRQCMLPTSRHVIDRVLADVGTAWDRETAAIEKAKAEKIAKPATPLRDKYGKRETLVLDRVRAAEPTRDKAGKVTVKSHTFANANEIVEDAIAKPRTKRAIAVSDLAKFVGAVERFAAAYDVEVVADILERVNALKVDTLIGEVSETAPAAPAPAAPAAEPVSAVAELDDVMAMAIKSATEAAVAAVMRARK